MQKTGKIILFLLLLFIGYLSLFYQLDRRPMKVWDESNNAINAMEMAESGNIFYRTIDGKPDLWYTKPPLSIWPMALLIKFFGASELTVRLPSAFFALFSALLLFHFCSRDLQNPLAGFCSGAVLLFSPGFIGHHIGRTGDPDSMLIFFMLLSLIAFFRWTQSRERKHLFLLCIAVFCGVMTKSVAAFFFLPGMVIWLLAKKEFRNTFARKELYLMGGLTLLLILSYYLMHEWMTPGYLKAVFQEVNRGGPTNDNGQYPGSFFVGLFSSRFSPWAWMLPFLALAIFASAKQIVKQFTLLCLLSATGCLLTITSNSAHLWHDGPVFPLLSFVVGFGMAYTFQLILPVVANAQWQKTMLTSLFFLGIFSIPSLSVLKEHKRDGDLYAEEKFPYLIEEAKRKWGNIPPFTVVQNGFNRALSYNMRKWKSDGLIFRYRWFIKPVKPNEIVAVCNDTTLNQIPVERRDTLLTCKGCAMVRIKAKIIESVGGNK
jgi:4-amino-4-deoxy-L-arabinose transferase-like glycosyltransferase